MSNNNNNNKKKSCKKFSLKATQKSFEIPLNIGFYRSIVNKDNRLISVYYVTPENQYLKDIAEVCECIETNKKYETLNRTNFNFVARKYTSHRNEYIIDYDTLPFDIKSCVIQRKRSIAPVIVTMDNEENLSTKPESVTDTESFIPKKQIKLKTVSIRFDDTPMELNITPVNIPKVTNETLINTNNFVPECIMNNHETSVESEDNLTEFTDNSNNTNEVEIKAVDTLIIPDVYELEPGHETSKVDSLSQTTPEVCELKDKKDDLIENDDGLDEVHMKKVKSVDIVNDKVIGIEYTNYVQKEDLLLESNNNSTQLMSIPSGGITHSVESQSLKMESEVSPLKMNPNYNIVNESLPKDTDLNMESDVIPPKLDDALLDSNDESMTLSVESLCTEDVIDNIVFRPNNSFEYPLASVNMNSLVEIGTHCHISRLLEFLNGESDQKTVKLMKAYCGIHCAFDSKGCPRVAFECDICLVLCHSECIGYRIMTVDTTSLIICDNCYLLQNTFNLDVPNTFCNVDKLLQIEFKDEPITNPNAISIPLKLESIFKLCKVNWMLQNVQTSKIKGETNKEFTELGKVPKKEMCKDIPKQCRYYIKLFINVSNIIRNLLDECIIVKYNINDVERMATIFADNTCKMIIHECVYEVMISKITVKEGELHIPVSTRIRKNGFALFYTIECGQECDRKYINRYENLKSTMFKMSKGHNLVIRNEQHNQVLTQPTFNAKMLRLPSNTRLSGPLSNKLKLITTNNVIMSPPISTIVPSFSSKNLPKNAIPISRNQIQNFTNILKIRKRKQDFSTQKISLMTSAPAKVQYHSLTNLPFFILEKIFISRSLSISDKLHCRLANRILKSVIDAGRVWNKAVIKTDVITDLQMMFEFFSQRKVKKITFLIDLQVSHGIDFFISFLERLKLHPETFILEKMSLKLIGFNESKQKFRCTIQDILSCNKFLKSLSVTSEELTIVGVGNYPYLSSDSLEKLKLRNIENVGIVVQTNEEYTPRLQRVHLGDCSLLTSVDIVSLIHITSLRMDFSECVKFSDVTVFCQLTNLQNLVVARPRVNELLKIFLGQILKIKSLSFFHLETEVIAKNQLLICESFGNYFPLHIQRIFWKIYLNSFIMLSKPDFKRKISDFMPRNVKLCILDV